MTTPLTTRQLIEALEKIEAEHGSLPVLIYDDWSEFAMRSENIKLLDDVSYFDGAIKDQYTTLPKAVVLHSEFSKP